LAASDLINLSGLIDDAKCFALVRQHRWPAGVRCSVCTRSDTGSACWPISDAGRSRSATCCRPQTRPRPWRKFLRNQQIALELGLGTSDTQAMTEQLRRGLTAKTPAVELTGEVETDEVYVVAGHKGQPAAVAKRGDSGAAASCKARRAELPKVSTAKPLERQRRARHAGKGQAAHPWPDPARRTGRAAHAGQRAADHD